MSSPGATPGPAAPGTRGLTPSRPRPPSSPTACSTRHSSVLQTTRGSPLAPGPRAPVDYSWRRSEANSSTRNPPGGRTLESCERAPHLQPSSAELKSSPPTRPGEPSTEPAWVKSSTATAAAPTALFEPGRPTQGAHGPACSPVRRGRARECPPCACLTSEPGAAARARAQVRGSSSPQPSARTTPLARGILGIVVYTGGHAAG